MKKRKRKLSIILLFLLPFFTVFLGTGCDEEDISISTAKARLIGKWKEQAPFTDGICDTILFKEDNTIELYQPIEGSTYSLLSADTIEITNNAGATHKCYFVFKK